MAQIEGILTLVRIGTWKWYRRKEKEWQIKIMAFWWGNGIFFVDVGLDNYVYLMLYRRLMIKYSICNSIVPSAFLYYPPSHYRTVK